MALGAIAAGIFWVGRTTDNRSEATALNGSNGRAPAGGPIAPPAVVPPPRGSLRECVETKACGREAVCWPRGTGYECVESNCSPDVADCPAGETCRLVSLSEKVFRCLPAGKVAEGAACSDAFPVRDDLGCAAGLTCWHGLCRRHCRKASDCGARARCVSKSPLESVCAADVCLVDGDCPPGRPACVEMRDGAPSTCARVADRSCRPGRCAGGQACDAHLEGDLLVGRCRKACDSAQHSCGPDEVCGPTAGLVVDNGALPTGLCYRRCSFDVPVACAEGETCGTLGGDRSVTVCRPPVAMGVTR